MTSMEERDRHQGETARNPQRRPVLPLAAGRRVPTQGNADGSGATFSPPSQNDPLLEMGSVGQAGALATGGLSSTFPTASTASRAATAR